MVRAAVLVLLVGLFACAYGTPSARNKRYASAYAGFPGAFAGYPFGGFPFGGGAYAGAGFGPSPWEYPRSSYPFSWFPFPYMPMPMNWYDGDNVCKEVRNADEKTPDEFGDWMKDEDFPNTRSQFNHEQESCKGSNTKYVCIKRIYDSNGGSKLQATKYECCHGFVRNPNGPGCIENSPKPPVGGGPQNPNDKLYYGFVPQQSSSSVSQSSSSTKVSKSTVDKVPVQ